MQPGNTSIGAAHLTLTLRAWECAVLVQVLPAVAVARSKFKTVAVSKTVPSPCFTDSQSPPDYHTSGRE